jgi:hypothetical protein
MSVEAMSAVQSYLEAVRDWQIEGLLTDKAAEAAQIHVMNKLAESVVANHAILSHTKKLTPTPLKSSSSFAVPIAPVHSFPVNSTGPWMFNNVVNNKNNNGNTQVTSSDWTNLFKKPEETKVSSQNGKPAASASLNSSAPEKKPLTGTNNKPSVEVSTPKSSNSVSSVASSESSKVKSGEQAKQSQKSESNEVIISKAVAELKASQAAAVPAVKKAVTSEKPTGSESKSQPLKSEPVASSKPAPEAAKKPAAAKRPSSASGDSKRSDRSSSPSSSPTSMLRERLLFELSEARMRQMQCPHTSDFHKIDIPPFNFEKPTATTKRSKRKSDKN